ncbi:MAG: hypothetical protein U1E33_08350 [Rhodospirillales bacterium]
MSNAPVERAAPQYRQWTMKGFLDEFVRIHHQMPQRAFAFILGAGASRSSGIPTGAELVDFWLEDIFDRNHKDDHYTIENWLKKNLNIDGFEYSRRDEYYPDVYKRRFRTDPASGQAYLEDIMQRAEPAFGYTILARLLTETRHNAVITTNFDNLVADAIFIYTDVYPLVCGHELLANFVRIPIKRPLIAKIHRDLLYDPHNSRDDVEQLSSAWKETIDRLFQHYTPVFIGYGGNDGSLMSFLENIKPNYLPGGIYWCHAVEGRPKERIEKILEIHNGVLVRIPDFDELMFRLSERIGVDLLTIRAIKNKADKRYEGYLRHILRMTEKISTKNNISLSIPNIVNSEDFIGDDRRMIFEKILEGLSDK